jgi:spermidine/putrescine transport system permease protein
MPYVVLIATARLAGIDKSVEEAAWDLGASPFTVFRKITLPLLKPAIIAGVLMAFTLSFDEVVVTFFTTGRANTLPMVIWSMLRFGLTPEVNAIATLTVVISLAFALVGEVTLRRAQS